jgi:hypothetical protein
VYIYRPNNGKGNYFKKLTYFAGMKFFRNKSIVKSLALMTGMLVLNMSLFLAEVEALKLLQDRQMTENIAKLLIGAANEEEKDFAGSAEEKTCSLKESTFILIEFVLAAPECASTQKYYFSNHAKATSPFLETSSPPPKLPSLYLS